MRPEKTRARASHFLKIPTKVLVFAISRRKRIVPVAVFVANSAVWSMNHNFSLLINRNLTRGIDSLSLRIVNACQASVTLASNAPVSVSWYYVLILSHRSPSSVNSGCVA